MKRLPAKWNAAQVSSFICGRPDWPFLASCFVCLWKEYAGKDPEAKAALTSLCVPRPSHADRDLQIVCAANEFFEEHGIPPHPSVLMKIVAPAPKQARKATTTPARKRRMTPTSKLASKMRSQRTA